MGHMIYNNFIQEAIGAPGMHKPPRPMNLQEFEAALLSSPRGDHGLNTHNNGLYANETSSGP